MLLRRNSLFILRLSGSGYEAAGCRKPQCAELQKKATLERALVNFKRRTEDLAQAKIFSLSREKNSLVTFCFFTESNSASLASADAK
ncbi:MAG: hypothetical protein IKD11_01810 [Oscillospiraceae bacterium]|nr:hypothetical protein [Oscillospiraceae bacterium]